MSRKVRLNKYIADSGVTSRRKADTLIDEGRVMINNKVVKELGVKVDPEYDDVAVDGESISRGKRVYYLLNKPKGYITTTDDEKNRPAVVDLISTNVRIYPVGRLDFNTTGVLILTNDGEFANLFMHPSNQVPRKYEAKLSRELSDEDVEKLLRGFRMGRIKAKFEKVEFTGKNRRWVSVTTIEGRHHFVKRMFSAAGYYVDELERTAFGNFTIGDLNPGEYRKLTRNEIQDAVEKYS